MDKVQGGTPKGNESMCTTCRYAQIIKGLNLQMVITCAYLNRRVFFPVQSCSIYSDKRRPSLQMMEEIAWEVKTRGPRGPAGFAPNEQREIEITPPTKKDVGGQSPV